MTDENLIQIQQVSKNFGDLALFENVTFTINVGEKIALIGRNGCGKSTLMKIILGEEPADSGNITRRRDLKISFLDQDPKFNDEESILDGALRHVSGEITSVIKEYENAINNGADADVISELSHKMDALNAWNLETTVISTLSRLGLRDINQKISTLSGGARKRVALASAIISDHDLLVLDEPTNHLDLGMVEWLEEMLVKEKKALLLVTHDRYFLDNVCNKILEIADTQIYTYQGNYSYYLEEKEHREEVEQRTITHLRNTYRRELEWIRRQPQARGGKSRSRIDRFDVIEKRLKSVRSESELTLASKANHIGSKIIELCYISKKYDEKVLLKDFYYNFAKGEKVGIVGQNGSGKTTLLKMILNEVRPDSGEINIGQTVRFGYYSQELPKFKETLKVVDYISEIADQVEVQQGVKLSATNLLSRFLFAPSRQHDYIYKLSGGEKRRLQLCRVLMENPNFLILDEPTNDLDIATLSVLEEYLMEFKGNVLIVSHDRYFMDRIVDHLFVFNPDHTVKDFPGNYTDYRIWKEMSDEKEKAEKEKTAKPAEAAPKRERNTSMNKPKLSYKEQRLLEQTEIDIDNLTKEKKEIEERLGSGEQMSNDEIMKLSSRMQEVIEELDEKEMIWLELNEKIS